MSTRFIKSLYSKKRKYIQKVSSKIVFFSLLWKKQYIIEYIKPLFLTYFLLKGLYKKNTG